VLTVASKLRDRTIGIHMHLLSLGPVFVYFSLLQCSCSSIKKVSILCLLFHRRIWMSQFTWNFLQVSTQLKLLIKMDAVMFSNLIRVYMDLSKWATIGLRSFRRDQLFEISFRVKLTSVCCFRKIALFLLSLMTALFLG
jgi:hypothetical protein